MLLNYSRLLLFTPQYAKMSVGSMRRLCNARNKCRAILFDWMAFWWTPPLLLSVTGAGGRAYGLDSEFIWQILMEGALLIPWLRRLSLHLDFEQEAALLEKREVEDTEGLSRSRAAELLLALQTKSGRSNFWLATCCTTRLQAVGLPFTNPCHR